MLTARAAISLTVKAQSTIHTRINHGESIYIPPMSSFSLQSERKICQHHVAIAGRTVRTLFTQPHGSGVIFIRDDPNYEKNTTINSSCLFFIAINNIIVMVLKQFSRQLWHIDIFSSQCSPVLDIYSLPVFLNI